MLAAADTHGCSRTGLEWTFKRWFSRQWTHTDLLAEGTHTHISKLMVSVSPKFRSGFAFVGFPLSAATLFDLDCTRLGITFPFTNLSVFRLDMQFLFFFLPLFDCLFFLASFFRWTQPDGLWSRWTLNVCYPVCSSPPGKHTLPVAVGHCTQLRLLFTFEWWWVEDFDWKRINCTFSFEIICRPIGRSNRLIDWCMNETSPRIGWKMATQRRTFRRISVEKV